ncbi:hypothetical protein JTB14_003072 [Gonioctena quinquepunctata]|nr:hypothetical protein JTB14_003072 [Gonioctena quinquepunctata]
MYPNHVICRRVFHSSNSDIKLLEELLQGDLHGNISSAHTFEDWSISNESETEDVLNPPTPSMRVDSLPEDELEPEKPVEDNPPATNPGPTGLQIAI